MDNKELQKQVERMEQLAKEKETERELKKRLKIAENTLNQDKLIPQLFNALKKKALS